MQACNSNGCTDSDEQIVIGNLESVVGILRPSEPSNSVGTEFKLSVSGDGNTLAVGTLTEVVVFDREEGLWTEQASAVSLSGSGDVLVAKGGSVEVYSRSAGDWQHQTSFAGGNSLAISDNGRLITIGRESDDSAATGINGYQSDSSALLSGAVFLFARSDEGWNHHAYVKASNTDRNFFGQAISPSADGLTLAVGGLRRAGIHL